ncbi:MAG: hypothetical protein HOP18_20705 [Deltaproteobacteria bacterium]|nr:hypothetical protein [Deltaproteobacteria bacterium]
MKDDFLFSFSAALLACLDFQRGKKCSGLPGVFTSLRQHGTVALASRLFYTYAQAGSLTLAAEEVDDA